jgi:hypothetical protein
VLVHGGMAQDVGPILEMVTEKYLLRSESGVARPGQAGHIFDDLIACLKPATFAASALARSAILTAPSKPLFPGPAISTPTLIRRVRAEMGDDFWGFWMLGGMSGGGMGFLFAPHSKAAARNACRPS